MDCQDSSVYEVCSSAESTSTRKRSLRSNDNVESNKCDTKSWDKDQVDSQDEGNSCKRVLRSKNTLPEKLSLHVADNEKPKAKKRKRFENKIETEAVLPNGATNESSELTVTVKQEPMEEDEPDTDREDSVENSASDEVMKESPTVVPVEQETASTNPKRKRKRASSSFKPPKVTKKTEINTKDEENSEVTKDQADDTGVNETEVGDNLKSPVLEQADPAVKEEVIEEEIKRPRRAMRQRTSRPSYKEIDSDEEKRLEARLELKRKARKHDKENSDGDDDYVGSESSESSESSDDEPERNTITQQAATVPSATTKSENVPVNTHPKVVNEEVKKEAAVKQFEKATEKNKQKYENQVKAGEILSMEEREKRKQAYDALTQDEKKLHQARLRAIQRKHIKAKRKRSLKMELKMLQCYKQLLSSLSVSNPNVPKCLEILTDMKTITYSTICLLKNPLVVECIRKVRHYKPDERIRQSALEIYKMFECMFGIPDKTTFNQHFQQEIRKFELNSKDWVQRRLLLVESTKQRQHRSDNKPTESVRKHFSPVNEEAAAEQSQGRGTLKGEDEKDEGSSDQAKIIKSSDLDDKTSDKTVEEENVPKEDPAESKVSIPDTSVPVSGDCRTDYNETLNDEIYHNAPAQETPVDVNENTQVMTKPHPESPGLVTSTARKTLPSAEEDKPINTVVTVAIIHREDDNDDIGLSSPKMDGTVEEDATDIIQNNEVCDSEQGKIENKEDVCRVHVEVCAGTTKVEIGEEKEIGESEGDTNHEEKHNNESTKFEENLQDLTATIQISEVDNGANTRVKKKEDLSTEGEGNSKFSTDTNRESVQPPQEERSEILSSQEKVHTQKELDDIVENPVDGKTLEDLNPVAKDVDARPVIIKQEPHSDVDDPNIIQEEMNEPQVAKLTVMLPFVTGKGDGRKRRGRRHRGKRGINQTVQEVKGVQDESQISPKSTVVVKKEILEEAATNQRQPSEDHPTGDEESIGKEETSMEDVPRRTRREAAKEISTKSESTSTKQDVPQIDDQKANSAKETESSEKVSSEISAGEKDVIEESNRGRQLRSRRSLLVIGTIKLEPISETKNRRHSDPSATINKKSSTKSESKKIQTPASKKSTVSVKAEAEALRQEEKLKIPSSQEEPPKETQFDNGSLNARSLRSTRSQGTPNKNTVEKEERAVKNRSRCVKVVSKKVKSIPPKPVQAQGVPFSGKNKMKQVPYLEKESTKATKSGQHTEKIPKQLSRATRSTAKLIKNDKKRANRNEKKPTGADNGKNNSAQRRVLRSQDSSPVVVPENNQKRRGRSTAREIMSDEQVNDRLKKAEEKTQNNENDHKVKIKEEKMQMDSAVQGKITIEVGKHSENPIKNTAEKITVDSGRGRKTRQRSESGWMAETRSEPNTPRCRDRKPRPCATKSLPTSPTSEKIVSLATANKDSVAPQNKPLLDVDVPATGNFEENRTYVSCPNALSDPEPSLTCIRTKSRKKKRSLLHKLHGIRSAPSSPLFLPLEERPSRSLPGSPLDGIQMDSNKNSTEVKEKATESIKEEPESFEVGNKSEKADQPVRLRRSMSESEIVANSPNDLDGKVLSPKRSGQRAKGRSEPSSPSVLGKPPLNRTENLPSSPGDYIRRMFVRLGNAWNNMFQGSPK